MLELIACLGVKASGLTLITVRKTGPRDFVLRFCIIGIDVVEVLTTTLKDLLIVRSRVFADERGYFVELYREELFSQHGISARFVQDNESCSRRNVLRGLHFQRPPYAQGKLLRVLSGRIFDVAVDLRTGSETFGKWFGIELSSQTKEALWIPEGFAHGFRALEDNSVVLYKQTNPYRPEAEGGVIWNDPTLGIDWGLRDEQPLISPKDLVLPRFDDLEQVF